MKKFLVILIITTFIFSACMSTKAVRLGGEHLAPTVAWRQIEVYRSADQIKGDYKEIALLVTTADTIWTSEKGMWNSMKKKAAKMGANAIILDAVSEPGAGAKVLGAVLGVGTDRKGKAVAIYIYPEEKD